jgi:hypothetical protein
LESQYLVGLFRSITGDNNQRYLKNIGFNRQSAQQFSISCAETNVVAQDEIRAFGLYTGHSSATIGDDSDPEPISQDSFKRPGSLRLLINDEYRWPNIFTRRHIHAFRMAGSQPIVW